MTISTLTTLKFLMLVGVVLGGLLKQPTLVAWESILHVVCLFLTFYYFYYFLGVLDPKESVLMAVSCEILDPATEDIANDRITIEWTNTPDGAAKQFRREWFQGDGIVRRKNLPIEYNL